jgi:hypothetical protein
MKTKEDFIKRLRGDRMYNLALKMASSDEERRRVIAITEGFVNKFASILAPMIAEVEKNPAYAEKIREAIKGETGLISQASGSIG